MSCRRIYTAGRFALYTAGLRILSLFAPFTPHIVEEIYQDLFRASVGAPSIHAVPWPVPVALPFDEVVAIRKGQAFIGALLAVRKYKGDRKLSMRAEVPGIRIACHTEEREFFENAMGDFKACTSAVAVEFRDHEERGRAKLSIPDTDFQAVEFTF